MNWSDTLAEAPGARLELEGVIGEQGNTGNEGRCKAAAGGDQVRADLTALAFVKRHIVIRIFDYSPKYLAADHDNPVTGL